MKRTLKNQVLDILEKYGAHPNREDASFSTQAQGQFGKFVLNAFLKDYDIRQQEAFLLGDNDLVGNRTINDLNESRKEFIKHVIRSGPSELPEDYLNRMCPLFRQFWDLVKQNNSGLNTFTCEEAGIDQISLLQKCRISDLMDVDRDSLETCIEEICGEKNAAVNFIRSQTIYAECFKKAYQKSGIEGAMNEWLRHDQETQNHISNHISIYNINQEEQLEQVLKFRNFRILERSCFKQSSDCFMWKVNQKGPHGKIAQIYACWYACQVKKIPKYVERNLGGYKALVHMYSYQWDKVWNIIQNEVKELFDDVQFFLDQKTKRKEVE